MTQAKDTECFYENLIRCDRFGLLSDDAAYQPLPKDWVVGVADIKGSTKAIAQGRYKTINMVGAAVISAQINALGGRAFPYVFGGDGAAFSIAPEFQQITATAMSAVKRWAKTEFDIDLRVAIIPVHDILKSGLTIGVARYQASSGVDYAMFNGGGISWAEAEMKSGRYQLPAAQEGVFPDLTGLSCRWSPVKAKNGTIASLVLQMAAGADPVAYCAVVQRILTLTDQLDRGGHPVPEGGPKTTWPPPGVLLEAHASRGEMSLAKARRKILWSTFIGWFLFKTGLKVGRFDPGHYQKTVAHNADFRKFDDGLKMTLDCDPATYSALEQILIQAREKEVVKFGLFQQDRAMMTCIVPSILHDDHVHFIDGASGGYTQAAAQIKHL